MKLIEQHQKNFKERPFQERQQRSTLAELSRIKGDPMVRSIGTGNDTGKMQEQVRVKERLAMARIYAA